MAMRDEDKWAAELIHSKPSMDMNHPVRLASLIREAQEDGAGGAACPRCGPGTDLNTALNQLGDERVALGWAKESIARLEAQVAALTERAERAEEQTKGWRERAQAAEARVRDLKSAGFAEVADIGEWPISSERKDAVFRLARERDEARQENEKLKEFAGLCS